MSTGTAVLPERYCDPRLVARGGMGEVYRATDTVLDRVVAIKLLDERYSSDEVVRKRFTREALAAARVSSEPGIVTIFDVGECEGRPFIVMEYLSGGSLQDVLAVQGAQPPKRVLGWLDDAAGALDRAHDHGVVHRDVKPANLLLDREQRVHVADFGVASAAGLDSLTKTGTVIGTAGYLSPEQAQGKPATPASDRYALGIVAFELLAGSRPFRSASSTVEALAHVRSPVPSLAERRGGLPGSLDAVLQRALAKSPADRFPTCAAFVTALHEAFAGPAVTDVGEPTRVLPPPAPRRRRRVLPLGLAIALAAFGALAAFLVSTRGGSGPARPQVDRVTVTRRGSTVIRTVTANPPATSSTPTTTTTSTTTPAATAGSPSTATAAAEGFSKMQGGDYEGALPLLEQAARGLRGSGSLAEAYNDFNLALTLEKLQGCSPRVSALLNASQAIQGRRQPIDALRRTCAAG